FSKRTGTPKMSKDFTKNQFSVSTTTICPLMPKRLKLNHCSGWKIINSRKKTTKNTGDKR
ncbi:hypothetical protein N9763_07090, partial [Polaribacter sp.]|nr:hypothetical protein [Polaribacter sp.]